MVIRTKDQNGTVGRIYGTIAKAASKGKFLDFRNALSMAYLEDYPNIQGIGGSEHAPASGIRLLIQDYSNGSKSTSAIIPCWQIDRILEVCRRNAVDIQFDGTDSAFQIDRIYRAAFALLKGGIKACSNILTGNGRAPAAEFGTAVKDGKNAFANTVQYPETPRQKPYAEYKWHQVKVNPYRKTPDGYAPVSEITIQRKQYTASGAVMNSPWSVSISNYEAIPSEKSNGTTSVRSGTARNKEDLFIQVSDDDMWRCCYAVSHFVAVWEMSFGIPLVQAGVSAYEKQQDEYRRNNGNYQ